MGHQLGGHVAKQVLGQFQTPQLPEFLHLLADSLDLDGAGVLFQGGEFGADRKEGAWYSSRSSGSVWMSASRAAQVSGGNCAATATTNRSSYARKAACISRRGRPGGGGSTRCARRWLYAMRTRGSASGSSEVTQVLSQATKLGSSSVPAGVRPHSSTIPRAARLAQHSATMASLPVSHGRHRSCWQDDEDRGA